jgi:hypothetical protein
MRWSKKADKNQVILPSGKTIEVKGDIEALTEFAEYMTIMANRLQEKSVCEHEWLEGMPCYQLFHSEPKRFQLLCIECGSWIDVDQETWQRYLAKELHRQNLEDEQADKEAEKMHEIMQPIYMLNGGGVK